MARRRSRSNGNNGSLMFIIIIGLLIYLLFPRLQITNGKENLSNVSTSINNSGNVENENGTEGNGNLSSNGTDNNTVHDIVLFVVGNTENSPAPKLVDNKNIKNALRGTFYNVEAGEKPNIVIFSAASEPKTIELQKKYFLGPAANNLASESNFNDLLKGIEKAANTSPSCSGADYFAAIIEALEYAEGYENPLIIIYGSGLSDTGIFNFAFDNLIVDDGSEEKRVFDILSSDKRFSNETYSNATVNWYGIGQTVGNQPELKEWKKSVENTYAAIFKYFDITYKFYSIQITADDTSVKTDYKVNITILPVIEEKITISLNERYLSFYPDTAKLKNKKEVENLLKGVANTLNKNENVKIKLTGYQTVCGKTKSLSIKRANTIKEILVDLGVDADRITTDGVAGPPDNRKENPRCGSTGIAVEHRTVILETY